MFYTASQFFLLFKLGFCKRNETYCMSKLVETVPTAVGSWASVLTTPNIMDNLAQLMSVMSYICTISPNSPFTFLCGCSCKHHMSPLAELWRPQVAPFLIQMNAAWLGIFGTWAHTAVRAEVIVQLVLNATQTSVAYALLCLNTSFVDPWWRTEAEAAVLLIRCKQLFLWLIHGGFALVPNSLFRYGHLWWTPLPRSVSDWWVCQGTQGGRSLWAGPVCRQHHPQTVSITLTQLSSGVKELQKVFRPLFNSEDCFTFTCTPSILKYCCKP